jgi:hypothetical protein
LTQVRSGYLEAGASVAALLRDPAVTAGWGRPSALPEFGVSGLAGHLARQVFLGPARLAAAPPDEPPISLLEHYSRVQWVGADPQAQVNAAIREGGEKDAADGPAALAGRTDDAVATLRTMLPGEPADRAVLLPWGPWALSLDDFLTTRMLEIAVHSDDLAVSVGIIAPELPSRVLDPVLILLSWLAVRRHGQSAVLSAFSRAERAPASIAAI